MIREVKFKDKIIKYDLIRKRVKNINLRIKPDLSVSVSANNRVSVKYIDEIILKKAEFILNAIDKYKQQITSERKANFTYDEFESYIYSAFDEVYVKFRGKEYKINKPLLKFRKMKSRWGSCNYVNAVITLNTNLIFCTKEQIYYVIVHEFAHLIVPNHSKDFYKIVEKFCPDYKRIKKEMAGIII